MSYNPFRYDVEQQESGEPVAPADLRAFFMSVFFIIILLVGTITTLFSSNWYNIYFLLSVVVLPLSALQVVSARITKRKPNPFGRYEVFGNAVKPVRIGGHEFSPFILYMLFSLLFGAALAFGGHALFSIAVPSSTASIGDAVIPGLATISGAGLGLDLANRFVVGIVAPDLEENAINSTLLGFFKRFIRIVKLGPPMLLLGFVLLALLYSTAYYIGLFFLAIGGVLIFYERTQAKNIKSYEHLVIQSFIAGLFTSGILFASLHGRAYSTLPAFQQAIFSAFLFGMLMFFLNYMLITKIFSRGAHSSYNLYTYALYTNPTFISYLISTFMAIGYQVLLYGVAEPYNLVKIIKRRR